MFKNELGKKIKLLRLINNFSQKELADKLGVVFQQINKYESGEQNISSEKLFRISKIFNIDIQFFFKTIKNEELNFFAIYYLLKKNNTFKDMCTKHLIS